MTNPKIAAIRERHQMREMLSTLDICYECRGSWPCDAIKALRHIEALEARVEALEGCAGDLLKEMVPFTSPTHEQKMAANQIYANAWRLRQLVGRAALTTSEEVKDA